MADINNTKYYNLVKETRSQPSYPPDLEEEPPIVNPNPSGTAVDHNSTLNKDGGDPALNEFYHLTKAEKDGLVPVNFETKLLSQAIVQWAGVGYIFNCLALAYKILGVFKQISTSSQITLAAGNSDPRIDGIYVDADQVFKVRSGTPSATPAQPTFNLSTEIPLTFISVPALSTTPTLTATVIYDENTESTYSYVGAGAGVSNDAVDPYQGSLAVKVTSAGNNGTSRFTLPGDLDLSTALTLGLQLQLFSAIRAQDNLVAQWFDASGVAVGNAINLVFNKGSNDPSVVNAYQFSALPIAAFGVGSTLVRRLDVKCQRVGGGTYPGWRLDIIKLESGITQPPAPTSGIPEAPSDSKIKGRLNGAWADARAVHIFYLNQAAMLADQVNQEEGRIYFDGTADWIKKAASTGNISDYRPLGSGGGGGLELITFSSVISMAGNYKSYHVQTAAIAYTRTSTSPTTNFENKTVHYILADGVSGKPTFSADFVQQKDTWLNTGGSLNRLTHITSPTGKILVWMENVE